MKKTFLFALSLVASLFTWAQTSPYTGSEAAAGNFYIYNVESGLWLQNNNRVNDWNSQVQVDVQGFDWELIAQEGGTWQLNPKFGNNHSLNSDADNGYMDTGRPVSAWTLTPVEGVSNGYTIESNGTKLGVNDNNLLVKDGSARTTWQLVTAEERLAKLNAQASEVKADAPVDITWMIPGANINIADERFDQLVITYPENATAKLPTNQGNNPGNCVREIWNNSGAYELGYTLTGLPDGVYRFFVSGFYRDGSTGGIGAKVADGTEEIRAFIYINEKQQPMMSVCQRTASGNGCNVKTGEYYVPDNLSDARTACSAGIYANPAIKVNVTDGTIKLGLKAETGVGGDWMVLDYFKLLYYGPDNIESSLALLNAAIENAEAWDASNTSTAMKAALDAAIADAKGKLTSTDSEEVEAAADALNTALKAAQALDLSLLKAIVDLAKKEGIDTSAADDIFTNATDGNAASVLASQLAIARKIKALGGAPDIYTGSEPAAGEFYFYNIGTGMWLNQGSDWCTHTAVDQAGLLVTFEESGEGFIFRTPWGSFNNSPYTDTGANTVYKFQAVEGKEKVYNILEGEDLLGYNPDGKTDGKKYWNSVSNVAGADPADPNYQWKIVSKAERDALVAAATKSAPVDATYLINNPSLMRQPGYNMWTNEHEGGNGGARVSSQDDGNGDRAADFGYEFWNSDSFKFYQKLENLPAGLYELSVQGFWREGDGGNQTNIVNEGGALNQKGYLFANDEKALLPNIASCLDFVPGVGTAVSSKGAFPNWPREAFEYFETGAYKTSVKVLVGEDGVLTIGVGVDEKVNYGDWVVFDNFRLTYLGAADDSDLSNLAYERALKAIEDGKYYRIFAEVDGQKYYVTEAGKLSASTDEGGIFAFNKVTGGAFKEYGFKIDSGTKRFTNPPLKDNVANLNPGAFATTTGNRNDWEAQVLFLNSEGKYAIRSCNTAPATSSWGDAGRTFWTWAVEDVTPLYTYDETYAWQLEGPLTPIQVTYALYEADGETEVKTVTKKQDANSEINIPADMTSNFAYDYTPEGAIGEEDCTIKVIRSFKAGVVLALEDLSNAKAYTIRCDRGALLTKDDFLASTAHSSLTNAEASNFAIISYEDNYYLYSVADGKFVTNTGALAAMPTNGVADAIQMDAKTQPYFMYYFQMNESTQHGLNTNGNDPYGYVINSWMNADPGNQYYMIEAADFDATEALAALDAFFHPSYLLTYVVKDAAGKVLFTSEEVPTTLGAKITTLPTDFQRAYTTYNEVDVTIEDENTTVEFTATSAFPFELSKDFESAKWYNMTIRSDYYVAMDETEPYYPATDKDLQAPESQWAFSGDAYNGIIVYNKAAGEGYSLTKEENNVVMREGEYSWTIGQNGDGFTLKEKDTEYNCINQNGGSTGPLQFWNSASSPTDNGSTFRVSEVPISVGINNLNANSKAVIFDLSGRKVNKVQKSGIYFIDDRKVMIK